MLRIQRAPRWKSGSDKVQRGWKGWQPSGHTAGELPPLERAHSIPRLICHRCSPDPPPTTQGSGAAWQSGVAGGSKKASHHHSHLSLVAVTYTHQAESLIGCLGSLDLSKAAQDCSFSPH